MIQRARIALALAVAGGALLGEAAWRGVSQQEALTAPPGWTAESGGRPHRLTSVAGDQAYAADAWTLELQQTIRPAGDLDIGPQPLSARVRIPDEGHVELWASAPDEGGVGLVLERIGAPSARVQIITDTGRTWAACGGPLETPGPDPIDASIRPIRGGVQVTVGDSVATCPARVGHRSPAIRSGLRRVQVSQITLGDHPARPPGAGLHLVWPLIGAGLCALVIYAELWMGAEATLVALTTGPLLGVLLLLGRDLRLWAETARVAWLPVPWLPAVLPLLLTVTAKAAHHLGRAMREPNAGSRLHEHRDWLRTAPVAAALPAVLAFADAPGSLDFVGVVVAGLLASAALGWLGPALMTRLGSTYPIRAATLLLTAATLAGLSLASAEPWHRLGVLYGLLGGTAVGVIVWANANPSRVRAYNATCLLASLVLLGAAEGVVRFTPAGLSWHAVRSPSSGDDIYSGLPRINDLFQRMDEQRRPAQPDGGYPITIPPRRAKTRVVALGGGATAPRNTTLDGLYTARLTSLLDNTEVLNQGVEGWTTWHIARYVEAHFADLQPDVLTLYVGRDDLLTPVPVPLAHLHLAWGQQRKGRNTDDVLRRSRLYTGLRYTLAALRPDERRVAVPLDDARENLRRIITAAATREIPVVLASEGLAPDPGPLGSYAGMLDALARDHDNARYIDTAIQLYEATGDRMFHDDHHLTGAGHLLVAEALAREIARL